MENGIKPSTIMLIAGGAVMFISTLLDWSEFGDSGWYTDGFGLLGIFVAIIGIIVAGGVALTTFANVNLPENILGFTMTQVYVSLSEAAFLITFGLQFTQYSDIGVLLGWIGAAVAVVGGIMEMQSSGASGASAPPTQF